MKIVLLALAVLVGCVQLEQVEGAGGGGTGGAGGAGGGGGAALEPSDEQLCVDIESGSHATPCPAELPPEMWATAKAGVCCYCDPGKCPGVP